MSKPSLLRAIPKEFREVLSDLLSCGWSADRTKKGVKVTAPNGRCVVFHSTPSDRRALKNFIAHMHHVQEESYVQ